MEKVKVFVTKNYHKINSSVKSSFIPMKLFFKKYKFQIVLSLLVAVTIFVLYHYLWRISFNVFYNDLDKSEKPLYIRNIAIALAAIATAVFTWWKNSISHKATEINQKETEIEESIRQDSLFAQAVGFLGEKNDLTTRKAGVHMLKDLALTSPKHAQKCIDMLCSLNEAWMPKFLTEYPGFFLINEDFPNIKNIEDLTLGDNKYVYSTSETKIYIDKIALSQLVLLSMSEIIRYINDSNEYKGPYILQHKYLCSINLYNRTFCRGKFDFTNIYLQSANLRRAKLQNADLQEAKLQNVDLQIANLQNIDLQWANLQNAKLSGANLQNAKLSGANLQNAVLQNANLQNAILVITNLQNAYLHSANLQNAYLDAADFTGAILYRTDFRNAKNIEEAIFDNNKKDAIFTDEDYKRYYPNP